MNHELSFTLDSKTYKEVCLEEIDAENFIGVKSYKARGKRISTYEVATLAWGQPYEMEGTVSRIALDDAEDGAAQNKEE